jgi:hypothetical protein
MTAAGDDQIVTGLPPESDTTDSSRFRQDALIAFLGSGLASLPTKAQLVSALATARRSVTALQARHQSIDGWLSAEICFHGIRENAATVATLEVPEMRDRVASIYRHEHPERADLLDNLGTTESQSSFDAESGRTSGLRHNARSPVVGPGRRSIGARQ